jgi:RimJ/RimL family protein N-acetyltransferase
MTSHPIVIETDRLVLRPHRLSDAENVARLWADPQVVRFIGHPSTRQESWGRLLRYAGHWSLFGYGYFAVEERATGAFLGDVGVAQFRRDGFDAPDGSAEAGWVLSSGCHGRGFGREAVAGLHRWIDATLSVARTHCIIDPQNEASIRLAHSIGYVENASVSYAGDTVLLLVRERGAC